MNRTNLFLFLCVAFALCACATNGPISAPLVGGLAGALAVFDQLAADGTLSPTQHAAVVDGIGALKSTVGLVQATQETLTADVGLIKKAQAGTLTTDEGVYGAVGLLALIRAWRGGADKGALAKVLTAAKVAFQKPAGAPPAAS